MVNLNNVKPVSGDQLKSMEPGTFLKPGDQQQMPPKTLPQAPPHQNAQQMPVNQKEQEIDFTDPTAMFDYVLYFHPKSNPAMKIYNHVQTQAHLKNKIWMQNISELSSAELEQSPWCNGVPILVNKRKGEAYRGYSASATALNDVPNRALPMSSNQQESGSSVNPAFGLTARS
tara:strand:+ start:20 stop:538 length:519 start_codon:yes stop_codon:yes gene_type:complete